ncbi:hypothetical protein C1Y35_10320 [Pseudomonas sp. GW456-L14]|nr:hypothetical protein C1Y35_10320 [Pseudomonas sp. GW456-L14]PMY56337.1 hypothetical protein C1Y34_13115 [Pseudomonas sp. GW456-L12]
MRQESPGRHRWDCQDAIASKLRAYKEKRGLRQIVYMFLEFYGTICKFFENILFPSVTVP